MLLYSDEWLKKGYKSGARKNIDNGQPIDYRYWYDGDKKIGATIDFEYAEDAHYEFLWEDFHKLIMLWGGESNFLSSMQAFFAQEQPYYIFSDFLDKNNIVYKRIVFF